MKDCIAGYNGIAVDEFLNDKSCCRKAENMKGTKYTERELEAYIYQEEISPENCMSIVGKETIAADPVESMTTDTKVLKTLKSPVKANPKEREQKPEGRLYCINTFEGKLGVAQFNRSCQLAASIIPINFMATPCFQQHTTRKRYIFFRD